MEKIIEILHYDYAFRALLASTFVGITCGVLGSFVILRRMALIGDALSHAVLPGVVGGFVLFGHHPLAIFGGAVVSGLLTALLITWIQRNSITKDDASIGIVFTGMFALGIIGISWLTKNEGIHLDMKDFLFGNVLGVSNGDLWLTSLIGVYVLFCIILFYKYFFVSTFDPVIAATMGISVALIHYFLMFLLSLTIVASIQSVGVILVVAMLIIPSSTAYLLTSKLWQMLFISAIAGLLSATLGLIISIILEITPGPTMTLVAVFLFMNSLLFSPKRGVIIKSLKSMKKRFLIDEQDVLKSIMKSIRLNNPSYEAVKKQVGFSDLYLRFIIFKLGRLGLVKSENNKFRVTDVGHKEGEKILRAHRLWETYLAFKVGVPTDKLHNSAEKMEHFQQTEFWDKVDQVLGFPKEDPHGAPIPKGHIPTHVSIVTLSELNVNDAAQIIVDQSNQALVLLWNKGLTSLSLFKIVSVDADTLIISVKEKLISFSSNEAKLIKVSLNK